MNAYVSPRDLAGSPSPVATPSTIRLPRRWVPVAFALTMSLIVSSLVSALLVSVNTGLDAGWPTRWLRSSTLAWALAFPLVFLLGPRVRSLVERLAT